MDMERSEKSPKVSFENWDITELDEFQFEILQAMENAAEEYFKKSVKAVREGMAEAMENTFAEYPPKLYLKALQIKEGKPLSLQLLMELSSEVYAGIEYEIPIRDLFDEWCCGWGENFGSDGPFPVDDVIGELKSIIEMLEKSKEEDEEDEP